MPESPSSAASAPPSVVILGADALLAALPATPTQLVNACLAVEFEGVFPATWGDELIAAACLERLETRRGPAICCTCPLVAERLRGVGSLAGFLIPLVSPPVATARYLRALCNDAPLRVVFVGDCPGGDDPLIDEHLSPAEFLARLAARGVMPASQPPDLGRNIPRDRRRFYSLPGGVPAPEWLAADWPKRTLVDLNAGDALADLARHARSRENTLIDVAPQLGCACSGAVGGVAPQDARSNVMALEPPRARAEILDPHIRVSVEAPGFDPSADDEVRWADFLEALPLALPLDGASTALAHTPPGGARMPVRRSREGVPLPRAYLASRSLRRRTRIGESPGDGTVSPSDSARAPAVDPALAPERDGITPRRSDGTARADHSPGETTAPRATRWAVHRAVQEGITGPRTPAHHRAPLPARDRWFLVATALACSLLVAAITSVLTVRGLATSSRAAVSVPAESTVAAARATATASRGARVADASDVHTNDASDSARSRSTPTASAWVDSNNAGRSHSASTSAATSPRPPAAVRLAVASDSTSGVGTPAASARERTGRASRSRDRSPASARAGATAHASTSDATRPRATAARSSAARSPSPARRQSPASIPTSVARAATSPAPLAGHATSTASEGSETRSTRASPATTSHVPTDSAASATSQPATSTNVDVAAELRAIRAEIEARTRHVDSLTNALDSLRRVTPPR